MGVDLQGSITEPVKTPSTEVTLALLDTSIDLVTDRLLT